MSIRPPATDKALTRRQMLKTSARLCGAAAVGGLTGFPMVLAGGKTTLRYVASGVNAYPEIAARASRDLGITIKLERAATIQENMLRAITRPKTLDIMDIDYGHLRALVQMKMHRAIETQRLQFFDRLSPVYTAGEVAGRRLPACGGAPFTITFLQSAEGGGFAEGPSEWMSLVPTVFNADTLGIRPDRIDRPIRHWRELLSPEFRGKTALINVPSIGILDAAMAIESAGRLHYRDPGNMSRREIDRTIEILIRAKNDGQFAALWNDFTESVDLMASGRVVIQSMWSPAVTRVRQMGIPCRYQPLEEGYRGWSYGLGLSRALSGKKLDAAYDFINWYHSGWVGAFMNRQGYYSAVPGTAKASMQPHEWSYWMEGRPAEDDIVSPAGIVIEKPGGIRDGGSHAERIGRIACWNSLMDESHYLLQRWQTFVDA